MKQISGLLRGYDSVEYPVAAVSDGKIVFMNRAAQLLADRDYIGLSAAELLGEELASLANGEVNCAICDCELLDQPFTLEFIADDPALYIFKDTPSVPGGAIRELSALSAAIRGPLAEMLQSFDIIAPSLAPENLENPDKIRRYLSIIERNFFVLMRLTDRLDALNMLTSPEPIQKLEFADLVSFVEEVTDSVRPMFSDLGIEIEFTPAIATASTIFDRRQIRSLLLTLLSNAASAKCDGTNKVTVSVSRVSGKFAISVSDTGQGIDPEKMSDIFSPNLLPEPYSAMPGLGSSIAWTIARLHEGGLLIESRPTGTKAVAYIAERLGTPVLNQPITLRYGIPPELIEFAPLLTSDDFHIHRYKSRHGE